MTVCAPARPQLAPGVPDTVAGYLARVLSGLAPLPPRHLPLDEADGAVLAGPGAPPLAPGTPVGPVQAGLLAAAGHTEVLARPRPVLTVLSAGNELAPPGAALVPGRIWECNSFLLAAAARQAGALVRRAPVVPDDPAAVIAAIEASLPGSDLLVTSGGISMGAEHDPVKVALHGLPGVSFHRVAMQPGQPQGFGQAGPAATPVFMLPGNPVSAFISCWAFVRPAIRALLGAGPDPAHTRAVLTAPVTSKPGRRSFVPATLDRATGTAAPLTARPTHHLSVLARASALIMVPEAEAGLPAGTHADVLDLTA